MLLFYFFSSLLYFETLEVFALLPHSFVSSRSNLHTLGNKNVQKVFRKQILYPSVLSLPPLQLQASLTFALRVRRLRPCDTELARHMSFSFAANESHCKTQQGHT